ncbi:glucosamine-6-phosphate isomerase [Paramagnetospirillum marisnigri]|uniref:Glucosamine-6-phosphate isomerase n=1 Tax=Paramagnetospirillum marisnigri TaxID=1285242 RepID=A0A178MMD2_9PROT|nr:glucosamine-6-phosphate deaminase [Paramagnetospirillum marisnigri]OAN49920.1 glucosamine-6-phosphate isomerase [Paramagnetospirillum marisnigri]
MLVLIHPDAPSVARRGAALLADLIARKPDAVIGVAAGATPLAMYADLVRRQAEDGLDCSRITVFGLDEYLGIGNDHPASCHRTLRHHLIAPLRLSPAQAHLLDSCPGLPLDQVCAAHEAGIRAAGGLDLQILGLGVNGHIGFNEPGCCLNGRTHVVALRSSTLATNRAVFAPYGEEVPRTAVSMGVGTILSAGRIMLLATGAAKAEPVALAVEGPLTAMVPASSLQLHADAVMLLDEAAAARLTLKDDYKAEDAALAALQSP